MKWQSKGHEYDEMYEHIKQIEKLYLFGAGHDGAMVWQILTQKYVSANLSGFIDNDRKKQGTSYLGLQVCALEEVELAADTGIVVTFASEFKEGIDRQLTEGGWTKGVNFFHYEELISVVAAYQYGQLFLPSVCILPTTACNLRCQACLNFTTYIRHFTDRSLETLKSDMNLLFDHVDYLGLLYISGGEPLLYPDLAALVRFLDETYGEKIFSLETVTNGTVEPKADFLQALRDTSLKITVDDYREVLPERRDIIVRNLNKLREYGGEEKVFMRKYDEWIDLYPYPQKHMEETELIKKYQKCHVPWQEYRSGKLYSCNYAAFASVAELVEEPDAAETYDFAVHKKENLKEAMEFRLGFSTKGFTEFCRQCAGYLEINEHKVQPAVQGERRER